MAAVKPEMVIMLTNIQTSPRTRPPVLTGALSPYPTVVMVTADHQKPLPIPWLAEPPNCSGFLRRSSNQISKPTNSNTNTRASTADTNFQLNRLRRVVTQPLASLRVAIPRPARNMGWVKSRRRSRSAVTLIAPIATSACPCSTAASISDTDP